MRRARYVGSEGGAHPLILQPVFLVECQSRGPGDSIAGYSTGKVASDEIW